MDNLEVLLNNPETRKRLVEALSDEILNRLSERIENEVKKYAEEIKISRRDLLKIFGAGGLLYLLSGRADAATIADDYILIGEERITLSPAQDGQLLVREGGVWKPADPSIDKWGGTELTPRDVTKDLKRLTEASLYNLKSFRVFTPAFFKPLRTFNLYRKISSDSGDVEEIGVVSGSGNSSETVEYVRQSEIVWIESMGLEAEFSATPDVTWNQNKCVRLKRRYYPYGSNTPIEDEEAYGGKASDVENWRHLVALSETLHYVDSFKKDSKSHMKCDLVALTNNHYWFVNEHNDEYIKLSADAGCFTYTDDAVALYMKGMVFSVDDILKEPTQ